MYTIINRAHYIGALLGILACQLIPDMSIFVVPLGFVLGFSIQQVIAFAYWRGMEQEPVVEAKPKKQRKQQVDEIPDDSRPPVHVVQHTLFGTVEAVQDKPEWVLQAEQRTGKTLRFDGQNWIAA